MATRQQLVTNTNDNKSIITEYLQALQIETNSSANYAKLTRSFLKHLSEFHKDKKTFEDMKRSDIVAFFNSLRKTDKQDPMHRWIGTYNTYLVGITRFFKWVENPDLEPSTRPIIILDSYLFFIHVVSLISIKSP